jgi:hypothetical protein
MSNIPPKLIKEFATITSRIEEAIRMDERHNILTRMAAEREADARRFLADIFSDRNGEQTVSRVKRPKPNSKLGRLHGCLASRTYAVNRDTLVRHSGMTPASVHKGIQELRERGYSIECVRQGTKPKYKLVA